MSVPEPTCKGIRTKRREYHDENGMSVEVEVDAHCRGCPDVHGGERAPMNEEDWTYFEAAQAKVYAAVAFAENVEAFIRALPWTPHATEDERTFVAGNLRNFAARLLDAIRNATLDEGSSKPAGTRALTGHEDTGHGAPTNGGESPPPSTHGGERADRLTPEERVYMEKARIYGAPDSLHTRLLDIIDRLAPRPHGGERTSTPAEAP